MDLKERKKIESLNRHPWELSRADVIAKLLDKQLKDGINILDIGCGDLFVEEYFIRKGVKCNFYCVDIAYSDDEVESLNQKSPNIKVYNNLSVFEAEQVAIDIVLLLDVIEHIEDAAAFLNDLTQNSFFTPTTQMLISVPAFQNLYTAHDRFLGHYRRYNRTGLVKLAEEVSLTSCKSGYFYFILLLPRFLQKMAENRMAEKKETTGLIEWERGAFVTCLLRKMLNMDYMLCNFLSRVGIKIPGLSTYTICQKKHA